MNMAQHTGYATMSQDLLVPQQLPCQGAYTGPQYIPCTKDSTKHRGADERK